MKMLIDSRWVEAADGQYFEVYNPATGAIVDHVPRATLEDARVGSLELASIKCGSRFVLELPDFRRITGSSSTAKRT